MIAMLIGGVAAAVAVVAPTEADVVTKIDLYRKRIIWALVTLFGVMGK